MKRYINIIAVIAVALFAACENGDQSFPDYDYQTVYFAYQSPVRTIELGEDDWVDTSVDNEHKCKISATWGGGYSNSSNITIRFVVDNDMVDNLYFSETGEKIYAMPTSYYTLSSDEIRIPSGSISGSVEVELTDAFFADAHCLENCYVIPLRLTHVEGADSILHGEPCVSNPNRFVDSHWTTAPKDYTLYCVKYINPWHASYLRRGVDEITGASGYESLTSTNVRHEEYVEYDEVVSLTTVSYWSVQQDLTLQDETGNNIAYSIILTFDEDGNCTVSSADPASYTVSGTGKFVEDGDKDSWGDEDRNAIFLDYTLSHSKLSCHTTDTLVGQTRGVAMETFTPEYSE